MTQSRKNILLVVLAGSLISVMLLAGSLSNLQLNPGDPFPGSDNADPPAGAVETAPVARGVSIAMLRGVFALVFIGLVVYVLASVIVRIDVKKILRTALVLSVILLVAYFLPRFTPEQNVISPLETAEIAPPQSFSSSVTPLGQPPEALLWLVIFIIIGGSIIVVNTLWQQRTQSQIEDALLQHAEAAVEALHDGGDLRNVILRCYFQMAQTLQAGQGIQRKTTMTVREFEEWLASSGFPATPVHRLTQLFEKVRYGEVQTDLEDEKTALESLNEIMVYCRDENG